MTVDRQAEQLHWLSYIALNGPRVGDRFRESLVHLDDEELPALISLAELRHMLMRTFDPVASSDAGFEQQMAARRAQNTETVVPQFHPLVLEAGHPASTPLFGFCP